MKKNYTFRSGLSSWMLLAFSLLFSLSAIAQPTFVGGTSQSMGGVCNNAGAVSINSLMAVNDPTSGSTLTWTVVSAPAHGTLGGFSTSATSTGGVVTPSGLSYSPIVGGYSGADAFTIQISDGTNTQTTTVSLTINPVPTVAPITGTATHCVGGTTTFFDTTSAGVWISLDTPVARIGATTGIALGMSIGTARIIYSVTNAFGCTGVALVLDDVIGVPTVPAIVGANNICRGSTSTYSDSVTGGVWSSTATSIATINSSTGVASGVNTGTTNISYCVTNTCGTTCVGRSITVDSTALAPILPASAINICVSATSSLFNSTSGGVWTSGNTGIATVSAAGVVTGVGGGTVTITYTVNNACGAIFVTKNVTITAPPAPGSTIAGPSSVCVGATALYTNDSTGGVWAVNPTSVATITVGGTITGVAIGSAIVSYTRTNACGSSLVTTTISVTTVPATPSAISGTTPICVGSTTTFSTASSGGTWSSSNPTIASISSSTGFSRALSIGNTDISYTVSNTCGSNAAVYSITVLDVPVAPSAITGTATVCSASTVTLVDTTAGGVWSSTNPSVATIDPTTGVVTALAGGTTTISYTLSNLCGASAATRLFTVNTIPAVPSAITGASTVCVGTTTALTSATTGGVWSSSATGIATVNPSTGVVRGVAVGSATITYRVSNSCGSNITTAAMTVNTVITPAGIGGTSSMCVGATTTLTNSVGGGVWTSSNTAVATVDSFSGVVTGVSGTSSATITYSITNACGTRFSTRTVTVTAPPSTPAAIGGTTVICVGASTTLTCATAGGTWSSANPAIATINTTGLVTGLSGGVATISYTRSNACGSAASVTTVTVNTPPGLATISGTSPICVGTTTAFTSSITGGSWSSGSTAIATVDAIGNVRGVSTGTTNISYTITNFCGSTSATFSVTVNDVPPVPAGITGPTSVCVGNTITVSTITTGGIWSSGNTALATINSSGVITGVSGGVVPISYTVTNACGPTSRVTFITINTLPVIAGITGTPSVCVGGTTVLSNTTTGGTWSSTTTSVATVDAAGVVRGVAVGTTTISYTVTNVCGTNAATLSVTVSTIPGVPASITGSPTTICRFDSTTYSSATPGGVWTSSNTAIASVNSSTGVIYGVGAGTANITYTVSNACGSRRQVRAVTITTVPAAPAAITGTASVCVSSTTTLSSATAGGTWSSSDVTLATVTTAGSTTTVFGLITGTVTISYTVSNSCGPTSVTRAVSVITVPNAPPAITGPDSVCVAANITLSDSVTGGSWSSATTSIATVNTSGVVRGVSGGIALISYTVSNVCGSTAVTKFITVNTTPPVPAAIVGLLSVCIGDTTTLSNPDAGGTWSSSTPSIATINPTTGFVTTVAIGSTTISYTVFNACGPTARTATLDVITVPATPAAIFGSAVVCAGGTSVLTDATSGGMWSSADSSIATIDAGGTVTGVTVGSVLISYSVSNACGSTPTTRTINVITIPAAPAPISGPRSVCAGRDINLTDDTLGGAWSSGNIAIATVNSSGLVHGITPGTVNITYTVSNGCGPNYAVAIIHVDSPASIAPIVGPTHLCTGATISLTCDTPGGTWASTNGGIATVSSSGVVTGVGSGVVTILYLVTNACGTYATPHTDTVLSTTLPPITGITSICVGGTRTLANAISGGVWRSQNVAVATVDSVTGTVSGLTVGAATISYIINNSCGTLTQTTTVNIQSSVLAAITGIDTVCQTATTLFHNDTLGGRWTSQFPAIATVDSLTGVITGISGGTSNITYTLTNACGTNFVVRSVTVYPLPNPGVISGPAVLCPANIYTMTESVAGGVWRSSNTSVATIDSVSGVVNCITAGTSVISYFVTNSCGTRFATNNITVSPVPSTASITGVDSMCTGTSVTLSNTTAGGVWSSSASSIATVHPTSGVVTGSTAGTATITYSYTNTCGTSDSTFSVRVNPRTVLQPITGTFTVCVGSTTTLANDTLGGSWSTASASIATVGSSSGIVTGVSAGTTNVTYLYVNIHGCSSFVTQSVTVNPLPIFGAISGTPNVCEGSTRTLTASVGGGTWSSASTSVATVHPTSGAVLGVTAGTTRIYYTMSNSCGSIRDSVTFIVNPLPIAGTISGRDTICDPDTAQMTTTVGGGFWSSSNVAIATVDPTSGLVNSASAGTATITHTVSNSCGTVFATHDITILAAPDAGSITAPASICVGTTTTLSETVSGGTWSIDDTTIAIVDASGNLTGRSAGFATIDYTVVTACGTADATLPITIDPLPDTGTISGTSTVCIGSTILLSETSTSGAFGSSNPAVATVNPFTGIVTGVRSGNVIIYYEVVSSCGTDSAHFAVRVDSTPNPGAVLGAANICVGDTTIFTTTGSGGTWSSANPGIATVNPTTGVVRGVSNGSAMISYVVVNACGTRSSSRSIVINALPNAGTISGPDSVCVGVATTYTTTGTSGGTWSSSNSIIAPIGAASGTMNPAIQGTVTISYIVSTPTCGRDTAVKNVTILPVITVTPISGLTAVCVSDSITLTNATSGGVWTSSSPSNATISATGVVHGLIAGSTTISYSLTGFCGTARATSTITVNALPNAGTITGPDSACEAGTISLGISGGSAGGTWTSSNTAIATVNASGVVFGVSRGTILIVYTHTTPCGTDTAQHRVTVRPLPVPGAITGAGSVCMGSAITVADTPAGGAWTSSARVTVNSAGLVTPISVGTAIVTYTLTNICGSRSDTALITVIPLAHVDSIAGSPTVCETTTITLTAAGSTGTNSWSSSNTSVATVNSSTGVVTGVAAGTTVIKVVVTTPCSVDSITRTITVLPQPHIGLITGSNTVCQFSSITLVDTPAGGTWISSNTAVATVTSAGVVTGATAGTTIITYRVSNSCNTLTDTMMVRVYPLHLGGTISGVDSVCEGSTRVWTSSLGAGGTWISANTTMATVSSAGVVTGVTAGSVNISYLFSHVCGIDTITRSMRVLPQPVVGVISGSRTLCVGDTLTLRSSSTLGTWSCAPLSVATITAGGRVTAVSTGSAIVTYTVTNSCNTVIDTEMISVSPLPNATLTGVRTMCEGTTITLTAATFGGTYTTSDSTIATVSSGGTVTAIGYGTAIITYSVTTPCRTDVDTHRITINPLPRPGIIRAPAGICQTRCVTLTVDSSSFGTTTTWVAGTPTIATVSTGGVLCGLREGMATISYIVTNSCGSRFDTAFVYVTDTARAGTLSGPSSVCEGATINFSSTGMVGGTWTSSDTTRATVSASGVVTGVSAGSVTITYTVTNICGTNRATRSVTVNPRPVAGSIRGTTFAVCVGSVIDLDSTMAGGVWSITPTTIATVRIGGYVTGVRGGLATLQYIMTNGCGADTAMATITVNAFPDSGVIIASRDTLCLGDSLLVTDTVRGGGWNSSNVAIATVNSAGMIYAVGSGSVTISYVVVNVCGTSVATHRFYVNPLPYAGAISGPASLCEGSTITLSNATATVGGVWSSSDTTRATISSSGVVRGIDSGLVTITYTATVRGCGSTYATYSIRVNPLPDAGILSGPSAICHTSIVTYGSSVSGGNWISTNTSVATINASGRVTAVTPGNTVIAYIMTNTCGSDTSSRNVTVDDDPVVGAVMGASAVCIGASTTLTDSISGGTWVSSASGVATISLGGVVTGRTAGSSVISYIVTNACGSVSATRVINVLPAPTAGILFGPDTVCRYSTISLNSTVSGGTWTSRTGYFATVTTAGAVTGANAGTEVVSYTVTNICGSASDTFRVRVKPHTRPLPIVGSNIMCLGTTDTLYNPIAGGSWSATNGNATITPTTGVISALTVGIDTIIYTISDNCGVEISLLFVNINPYPDAGTITGRTYVCEGDSTLLFNTASGGYWSSNNISVATVSPAGYVVGVSPGDVVIAYNAFNVCGTATDTFAMVVRRADRCNVGVEPIANAPKAISIFPNPATSTLHIAAPTDVDVLILSPDGKVVIRQNLAKDIDVSNIAAGLYMVMVYDAIHNLLATSRFVKTE